LRKDIPQYQPNVSAQPGKVEKRCSAIIIKQLDKLVAPRSAQNWRSKRKKFKLRGGHKREQTAESTHEKSAMQLTCTNLTEASEVKRVTSQGLLSTTMGNFSAKRTTFFGVDS
jgi:hypothetical protein